MKITVATDLSNIKDEDITRFVSQFTSQTADIINGNISFADNFKAQTLSVTFSSANTDVQVSHGLKKVPTGYIIVGASSAMSVYDGSSSNTADLFYVRSSATGTARILIY